MTSKQRAYLRALANPMESIVSIGKQGVTPESVAGLDEALEARELVKATILPNCEIPPREAAELLAGRARAEVVQVIGRKVVLYRRAKGKPVVALPLR